MAISSGERGTASQQQDRANQRDRDRSVASGGSGERGTRSQMQDRRNMANALRGGNRAPGVGRGGARQSGMSDAAAMHDIYRGKISTPSIPGTGVAQGNYPTQDDAGLDFSKAVGKHATRGFMDKALDWLGGGFYDPKEPMAGNPRSFAEGDYHSTTNPGSVAGTLAGMFGGGVGSVVGKIAGPAYTRAGLPELWHGGYSQPDLRGGPLGNTSAPMGSTMADIGSGHTYSSGGGPMMAGGRPSFTGGGTGNGGLWGRRNAMANALRSGGRL